MLLNVENQLFTPFGVRNLYALLIFFLTFILISGDVSFAIDSLFVFCNSLCLCCKCMTFDFYSELSIFLSMGYAFCFVLVFHIVGIISTVMIYMVSCSENLLSANPFWKLFYALRVTCYLISLNSALYSMA